MVVVSSAARIRAAWAAATACWQRSQVATCSAAPAVASGERRPWTKSSTTAGSRHPTTPRSYKALDECGSVRSIEPRTYQTREEMPERFRETLEQMMKSQAYRELAAARMFGHGLQYVAESRWLKFMVWHIGEETEHYLAVARMYEKFTGHPVEEWVNQRLTEKPVPFAQSWFELAM